MDDWDSGSEVAFSDAPSSSQDHYVTDDDETRPAKVDAKQYKVLDSASLKAAQRRDLDQVRDVLGVNMHQAQTLLIHYRWNVENLFGFMTEAGQEELFRRAGLVTRTDETSTAGTSGEVTCGVCFCDSLQSETSTMDCGHTFCNTCWATHFKVQINDGQSRMIKCMMPKCGVICNNGIVSKLVSELGEETAAKYETCLLESYIEDNAKAKWCPSVPHCGFAVQVLDGDVFCEPECSCGHKFCFSCRSVPHSPCSCRMWKLWEQKCNDESETNNWITAHTKPCPKCGKLVEKNGGCNLVGCRCGQAFCWLCGAATGRDHTWTAIAGHSCGRYKDEKDREIERAARDLKRYIHYHSRFKGHMDSLKLEAEKLGDVELKVEELASEGGGALNDYSWLSAGIAQLQLSRGVLAYSYPFAFCMFGDSMFADEITPEQNVINQNLFEDQQQQLESTVENLSHHLHKDVKEVDEEVRMDVVNLTALANTRCSRMYDVVENDLLSKLQLCTEHIAPYSARRAGVVGTSGALGAGGGGAGGAGGAGGGGGGVALVADGAAAAKGKRVMDVKEPWVLRQPAGRGGDSPSKRGRHGPHH